VYQRKTYFFPFVGLFFLFFFWFSLSSVFGRLLAVSSTLEAWRLRVTGFLLERVRGGMVVVDGRCQRGGKDG
jgi:hypothetical protein